MTLLTLKPLWGYLAYHRITTKEFSEKTGISLVALWHMKKHNSFTTEQLNVICSTLRLGIKDIMRYDEQENS